MAQPQAFPEFIVMQSTGQKSVQKPGRAEPQLITGRAIYVTDIATDPLWDDYRHLALPHGLQACWSTPIRDPEGKVLGTFAVYHPTPRSPTPGEVESIQLITDHVAQVIMWNQSRAGECGQGRIDDAITFPARLRLVSDNDPATMNGDDAVIGGPGAAGRFHGYAMKLDRYAEMVASRKFAAALKAAAADCRKLGEAVRDRQKVPEEQRLATRYMTAGIVLIHIARMRIASHQH